MYKRNSKGLPVPVQHLNIERKKRNLSSPPRPSLAVDPSSQISSSSPLYFTNYYAMSSFLKWLKTRKSSAFSLSTLPPPFHITEEKPNSHYHSPAPLSGNVPPHMEFSKSQPAPQLLANSIPLASLVFFLFVSFFSLSSRRDLGRGGGNFFFAYQYNIIAHLGHIREKKQCKHPRRNTKRRCRYSTMCSLSLFSLLSQIFSQHKTGIILRKRGERGGGGNMYYRRILLGPIPWILGWIL